MSRTGRQKELAALAGSIALSFLILEGGLRIASAAYSTLGDQLGAMDSEAIPIEPYGSIGYRQMPNSEFPYRNGTFATSNGQGFRGPEIGSRKREGEFRILLLGGSATHGWGVGDDQTLDAQMRRLLAKQYPIRATEVINLAFDGYDSYQMVERLRSDGLRLGPDLVIVNAGVNDVRNATFPGLRDPDPRTLLYRITVDPASDSWTRKWFWHAKRYSYVARTPTLFRKARFAVEFSEHRSRAEPNDEAAIYFGRNLQRIADLLALRRIPIVLSTPPSSLASKYKPDDSEGPSYWLATAAETEKYRERLAEQMRRVAEALNSDGYPARYLRQTLPVEMFLDSCHLTPQGNEALAEALIETAARFLPEPLVRDMRSEGGEGDALALE